MAGRPTIYNEEVIKKVEEYLNIPRPNDDEVIPSIEGLSLHIGIARSTIYEWISQEDKQAFSDIVNEVLAKQGKTLINQGLSGKFNPAITKVILTKHNYRDSQEITGKDGKDLIPDKETKDKVDAVIGSFINDTQRNPQQ